MNDHHKTWNSLRKAKHSTKENIKTPLSTMAELCQKLPVVLKIDTEKNPDAEHELPVRKRIEDIIANDPTIRKAIRKVIFIENTNINIR
ncbi:MAG: hypothetical protein KAV87_40115 [Desulfobacteraceae bacterium]|nr:hypothetical protein [Desulfobacteraceae bacterium]